MLNLKKIRKDLKLNQIEFAESLEVTQAYISSIEKGKKPSDNFLDKLAAVYGVSVESYKSYNIEPAAQVKEPPANYSTVSQRLNEHDTEIKNIYKELLDINQRLKKIEDNRKK
jgi:transcriptional regulator with XRE-family HTH domain